MPELPEVETVRCGLTPSMVGAVIKGAQLRRPDLRYALPPGFAQRLTGAVVESLDRRGKYLLAPLSTGEVLIMHLGMSGRFTVHPISQPTKAQRPGHFHFEEPARQAHDHVVLTMAKPDGTPSATIIYNDPRRFGFMDLVALGDVDTCRHFDGMGPEPLGNGFSETVLAAALSGRKAPIKQALLDQSVVAGLGNIYVCEALFRAGISPKRRAMNVPNTKMAKLYQEIVAVLREAIVAGGSSLRDFAASDGAPGYFQHNFKIYGREGEACHECSMPVRRIVQSGRSTFFCGRCQR